MLSPAPVWRILILTMAPVIAAVLVLPPAPVSPVLHSHDPIAPTADRGVEPVELEIVNPNLASLEFDFEPVGAMPELAMEHQDEATRERPAFEIDDRRTRLAIEALNEAPATFDLFTASRAGRSLTLDGRYSPVGALPADNQTGWADGISRRVVPVPFLKWHTDQRSAFSIGISHQSYGEETDVGVMGMWSIDF